MRSRDRHPSPSARYRLAVAITPRRRRRIRWWLVALSLIITCVVTWHFVKPRRPQGALADDGRELMIVIDPGHGGRDPGSGFGASLEKDLALDTSFRVEESLKRKGFRVRLTRRDDSFLELEDRSAMANEHPNALFISVHFNSGQGRVGSGVETFYAEKKVIPKGQSREGVDAMWHDLWHPVAGTAKLNALSQSAADLGEKLAAEIQRSIAVSTGLPDRGSKPRDLAVVMYTRCPAVLVEGGFLNNPTESARISTPQYRQRLADGIVEGILSYQRAQSAAEERARLVSSGG
jgi:N-acetylmuramoyl-L-alanine amidase